MRRVLLTLALLAVPAVACAQQAETIEYYGTDAIGSIRIVWDANGTMTARQDFTPFGEPVLQQGTAIPKEGFVGNETDAETNQDYFHARMFEARTGRFTRTDPVEDGLVEPQRWNRYAYGLNNPISFVDANGLEADPNCDPGYICVHVHGSGDPDWDPDPSDPCGWWGCDGEGGSSQGTDSGAGDGVPSIPTQTGLPALPGWVPPPTPPTSTPPTSTPPPTAPPPPTHCQIVVQREADTQLNTKSIYLGPLTGPGIGPDGYRNGAYNYNFFFPNVVDPTGGNFQGRYPGSTLHIPPPGQGDPTMTPWGPGQYQGQDGSFATAHMDSANPEDLRGVVIHFMLDVVLQTNHGC